MTKLRQPNSLEEALIEIYATLGISNAAAKLEKSEAHLRRWSDPDRSELPNMKQVAILDAECMRKSGRAPMLEVYGRWMKQIAGESKAAIDASVTSLLLEITSEVGQVAEEMRHAISPDSESGEEISANEATKIRRMLTALVRSTECLDGVLKKKQRAAAPTVLQLRPKN